MWRKGALKSAIARRSMFGLLSFVLERLQKNSLAGLVPSRQRAAQTVTAVNPQRSRFTYRDETRVTAANEAAEMSCALFQ